MALHDDIAVFNLSSLQNSSSVLEMALKGVNELRPTIRYIPMGDWSVFSEVGARVLDQSQRNKGRVVAEGLMLDLDAQFEGVPNFETYGLRLVLLDEALCDRDGGWCMGAMAEVHYEGIRQYALISTAGLKSDLHLLHVSAHELGHAFGAPSAGRRNTVDLHGLHCANDICVMMNQSSSEESHQYALARYQRVKDQDCPTRLYCGDCTEDIKA